MVLELSRKAHELNNMEELISMKKLLLHVEEMNKQRRRKIHAHGCSSCIANLFVVGAVGYGKKFFTDKPHLYDGSMKRNQFDQIENKVALRILDAMEHQ